MNFHPILFAGEMIRANLEGRKTQTRQVVKFPYPSTWDRAKVPARWDPSDFVWVDHADPCGTYPTLTVCPYGVPGDVLWARETWATDHKMFYPCFPVVYAADGSPASHEIVKGRVYSPEAKDWFPFRWRPSIHMPKWACRLWCRVESVRVERVQDISEADAAAEGVAVPWVGGAWPWIAKIQTPWRSIGQADNSPKLLYSHLWDSINAKRGFGWKANPWVWAITYTPTTTPPDGWAEYCREVNMRGMRINTRGHLHPPASTAGIGR